MKLVLGVMFAMITTTAWIGCSDSDSSTGNVTLKGSGSTTLAARVLGVADPVNLKIKVYKFAVSTSADCSSPITVYSSTDGVEADFLSNPTIGSGTLADGTYPCVIFEMSDIIKFTPATTSGLCAANTEYSLEVCRADGSVPFQLVDGTTGTCAAGEQRVAIYVSTNSASSGGGGSSNAFMPPTAAADATHGIQLTGALTIAGAATATFVVDGTGQVDNGGDSERCDMQPPTFGFTSGS